MNPHDILLISVAAVSVAFCLIILLKLNKRNRAVISNLEGINRDFQLIQGLAVEISSELEQSKVLKNVMNAFIKAGNVNKGSIMLLNESTQELEIVEAVGLSERAWKFVRPKIGEGIGGKVAATGKPILINNTSKDVTYKDFVVDEKKGRPTETLLCLPLTVKGMVIGVVNLDSKITGEQFFRNDEILMSIIANQAAVAIYNSRLYEMAITDGLTKLFIHRYLQERLKMEAERARRYDSHLSFMMIDLDKFKSFNDTYGHQVGDRVLVFIAKMMKESTRNVDFCARYGGEEFAVFLPETNAEEAYLVSERLRKRIETETLIINDQKFNLTVSIGVATTPFNDRKLSAEELIKNADRALYYAKENGRNKVDVFERIYDKLRKQEN